MTVKEQTTQPMETDKGIQLAAFGRTGHASTRAIFGGFALAPLDQDAADRALVVLQQYGVNHLDTAPSYGDSELRIGPWMDAHRKDFFLATKTDQRTYDGARRQIEASLERLRVDQVDLLQLHNLIEDDEWETVFGPDGALKALVQARDEGLTRFVGVTGHSAKAPAMHLRSLRAFDFDSVLLPVNYPLSQNQKYAADFQALLEVCEGRQVAVQIIKSVARRRWADPDARPLNTWYEPVQEQRHIDNAVQWVLGRWPVFLITAGEVTVFAKILDAAARLERAPSDAEMAQMAEALGMQSMWP
jgi:aryl-alcohol dehydrogenase-like predicted oxidoreductase